MKKWFYVEFAENFDYPDDPEIIEACETTDDDDAEDGAFVFVVSAETLDEAIQKALIEYRDNAVIERDMDVPLDNFDY